MPVKSRMLLIMTLASVFALMSGRSSAQQRPTLVEVWCGGDDGLTIRLRDAVEHAFSTSPDFQMSSGKLPGTLLVTIPTHVEWKRTGKKTRVLYKVDLSVVGGKDFGKRTGACWDNDLQNCSRSIVKDARDTVHKRKDDPRRGKAEHAQLAPRGNWYDSLR